MKIRALVVEAKDAPFKLQEIELADPGRGEVLVRIAASGVCHTDAITRAGDLPMPFPCVLGHEGAGTVEKVGPGVTTLAPGDKVIIGWPSCGECRNCLDGHPRYCLRTGDALVSGRRFKG
ncbi:MAG: alcohol dehydrogenase catalytic domain-containing protein, partial [Candidatus Rokuibacteriota bacterium]